ncbi:hypothetical protein SEA_FINKLE_31 [Gordonia phage Finkle]|uniref:Uncharacterized protein n=1 Tax=Gordonia phage Finkle TaxID=2926099 RepID=A0A9E7NHI7_9CAUD|nr:hypothetical protein QEH33_gp31 [Gordonia phage Finkle]UTN92950.1 hypothetical protein SEA_FINKLE_31 [Gordonia phage Finkle]
MCILICMSSWYRIQEAGYEAADLLIADNQISRPWGGDEDRDSREGISVCGSREELAEYLVQAAIPFGAGEWNLIELEGQMSGNSAVDAELGEYLVYPTAIISVENINDGFLDEIDAAADRIYGEGAF